MVKKPVLPPPGPRPLIVAIGASNLSRGLSRLVTITHSWAPGPVDLAVAAGHGRSYGANSRVWNRRLPSILGSGLWRGIDRLLAAGQTDRPRVAVVTDIGNDLLYGFSSEQLAVWVDETLARLQQRGFTTVITRLPLASITRVGKMRYRLLKTLFVPGCQLSLEQIKIVAAEVDAAVIRSAATYQATVVDQPGVWYGFDALHIKRSSLDILWNRAVAGWKNGVQDQKSIPVCTARHSWRLWAQLGTAAAEVRSLNQVMRFTPQPAVEFRDTTRVFLY